MGETHELKSWPDFFQPIWDRKQLFDLRFDDRNFQVDHNVTLREWDPDTCGGQYTGRACGFTISYILTSQTAFGMLLPRAVILGFTEINSRNEDYGDE